MATKKAKKNVKPAAITGASPVRRESRNDLLASATFQLNDELRKSELAYHVIELIYGITNTPVGSTEGYADMVADINNVAATALAELIAKETN